MAVRARQTLDFRGVLAELGRPTVEIALGRPTHQHEGDVAEDGIVDRLQRLHERNIPDLTGSVRIFGLVACPRVACEERIRGSPRISEMGSGRGVRPTP